ncbi:MAG: TlpA family protein disulfide reductase [Phycisphaerales bacterium]
MIRISMLAIVATLLAAADGAVDPKWLDSRVPAKVRQRMESLIGQTLPQPPGDLRWIGGEKPRLTPGQIVLIQSIGASGGKALLEKTRKALPEGVVLVAVHASKKTERLEKDFAQKSPCPIALDTDGLWAAALDLPETPVNLVTDLTGKVRLVGIRTESLKPAIASLEQAEPAESKDGSRPMTGFPAPSGTVEHATDRRGQKMPEFFVEQWITDRPPAPAGKLLVIDFWATWCGPCVASIPHMNDLATKFTDIAQCVGVSDEQQAAFQQGMTRIGKSPRDFRYALALAPSKQLHGFFGVQAIPHCVVVSSDGVVRWQGLPGALTEDLFKRFADAQRALNAAQPAAQDDKPRGTGTPRKY